MGWKWLPGAKRYYNDTTKRFLSNSGALDLVQESLNDSGDAVAKLAELVASDRLSPSDWNSLMRQEIKEEYIRMYMLGRGGRASMTQSDWGAIGGMLSEQYKFLDRFEGQIATSDFTSGQIATRASMYTASAREGYERGKARSFGIKFASLPAYPGDGSTICLTNDKCAWELREIFDDAGNVIRIEAYWILDAAAEHCSTCLGRATTWNPYIVESTELIG